MLQSAERLAEAAEKLSEAEVEVALSVAKLVRQTRLSRLERAFIAAVLLLLVWIAWGNKANGDHIRSCTTPAGRCYQDGQRRTADVVRQLQDLAVASAQCAREPSDAQIKACVDRKVNR